MWVEDVYFDGTEIRGTLLNSPNKLSSVDEGDSVTLTLDRIEDWLCALDDQAYGGYSVQVLRSRMNDDERDAHDEAWGLIFPAPDTVLLPDRSAEFEENMLAQLKEQIESEPGCIAEDFGEGRTLLHLMCLYGRAASVRLLLAAGADPTRRCDRGWTPIQYANAVGWDDVTAEFARNGIAHPQRTGLVLSPCREIHRDSAAAAGVWEGGGSHAGQMVCIVGRRRFGQLGGDLGRRQRI